MEFIQIVEFTTDDIDAVRQIDQNGRRRPKASAPPAARSSPGTATSRTVTG
jgi:hypothetical protein